MHARWLHLALTYIYNYNYIGELHFMLYHTPPIPPYKHVICIIKLKSFLMLTPVDYAK